MLLKDLSRNEVILLTNKYDSLIFSIKKLFPKAFKTIINSRNILETFLNFVNLNLSNTNHNDDSIYRKYDDILKKLNIEIFLKTLIMLLNLAKSTKKIEIFSYILSRKVYVSNRNIITLFNIFDLSNISGEKCHDLIKFLFSKPYRNVNPYIYYENLFEKMTTLFLFLSKKKEKESDMNTVSRLNGLNNLIFLILREVVTTYKNDHFLIYLLFQSLSLSFFRQINCYLDYNIKEKKMEIQPILNNQRERRLNIILSNFLNFYYRLEDVFKNNFSTYLMNSNAFFYLMKFNYQLDHATKIQEVNKEEYSVQLIKGFKQFLLNFITSCNEDLIGEKLVKFFITLINNTKQKLLKYCRSLPKDHNVKSTFFDYKIQLENSFIKKIPIQINLLSCYESASNELDNILNEIDVFINLLSQNELIIYSIFKSAFEKFVKIKEISHEVESVFNEDLFILKENSLIDDETIKKLSIYLENIPNQKKCILLKIIDSCCKKINLNVFKTPEIFNLIYHILEQNNDDSEILELAINCLGFSIINYQELMNLLEENKNLIVKFYRLVKILENYEEEFEASKEIKTKILQILTLKEISEDKSINENKQSKEEDQLLTLVDVYLKNCNIQKFNDNFEKSYSLFLIYNNLKVFKNKNLSLKTIKLLFDILIENMKNIDSYLSEVSIKILSILVEFDVNFVLNLLYERIKSIKLEKEIDSEYLSLQSQFLSKIIEALHKIVRRFRSALSIFINKLFEIVIYFFENLLNKLDKLHICGLFILLSNIVNYCGTNLHMYLDMIIRTALNFLNNFTSYDIEIRISSAILLFKVIQNCDFNHYSNHARSIYNSIKSNYESSSYNKENKLFKYHLGKSLDLIKENVREFYVPTITKENLEINILINKDN